VRGRLFGWSRGWAILNLEDTFDEREVGADCGRPLAPELDLLLGSALLVDELVAQVERLQPPAREQVQSLAGGFGDDCGLGRVSGLHAAGRAGNVVVLVLIRAGVV
jgi:hypothetical protein